MNIGKKLLTLINEEKNRSIYTDPKQQFFYFQHQEDDFQFQIKYKDIENSGIVLDYIVMSKSTPILDVTLLNKKLDEQANGVQQKITYLLEDFKLIEMDSQNKRAQLRSYPPYEKESSKCYYEIVLDEAIKIHFQRYEYSISDKRYEKITSQLTKETFERLMDNLIDILK